MSDQDDFESAPESDPYCAHWISIFDEKHEREDVRCANCGASCREHAILFGAWCDVPAGTPASSSNRNQFRNVQWPAEELHAPAESMGIFDRCTRHDDCRANHELGRQCWLTSPPERNA